MSKLEFWSDNRRYGLVISDTQVKQLKEYCLEVQNSETGGILVGQYNGAHDCAIVTVVTGEPHDSRAGSSWFSRGKVGLQRWLRLLWPRREYYLGEWHYHPHGQPLPSGVDAAQMQQIATSTRYHCPEPLLVIVGGDKEVGFRIAAYVTPNGASLIQME